MKKLLLALPIIVLLTACETRECKPELRPVSVSTPVVQESKPVSAPVVTIMQESKPVSAPVVTIMQDLIENPSTFQTK